MTQLQPTVRRLSGLGVLAVTLLCGCATSGTDDVLVPQAVPPAVPSVCPSALAAGQEIRAIVSRGPRDEVARRSLAAAGGKFATSRAAVDTQEKAERLQDVADDVQAYLAADRGQASGLDDVRADLVARLDAVTRSCSRPGG
jgi:hypothetical protein